MYLMPDDNVKFVSEPASPPRLVNIPEEGKCVTTPPEIILYYRLNHSFWSLSDNKEVSH
jgi:hypothetical protein